MRAIGIQIELPRDLKLGRDATFARPIGSEVGRSVFFRCE